MSRVAYKPLHPEFRYSLHSWMMTHGLSRYDAAAALGVSGTTVNLWLSGQKTPSMHTFRQISKKLRVPEEQILSLRFPPPPEGSPRGVLSRQASAPPALSPEQADGARRTLSFLCRDRNLPVPVLARAMKATRLSARRVLAGKTVPDIHSMRLLAEALGVPEEAVLSGDTGAIPAESILRLPLNAPPLSTPFGAGLAALREQHNLSREGLATVLQCSWQQLYEWETDGVYPGGGALQRVASALGAKPGDLLLGKFPEVPPEALAGAVRKRRRTTPTIVTPDMRYGGAERRMAGGALRKSLRTAEVSSAAFSEHVGADVSETRMFSHGTPWPGRDAYIRKDRDTLGGQATDQILSGVPSEIPPDVLESIWEKTAPCKKSRVPNHRPKEQRIAEGKRLRRVRRLSGWTQEQLGCLLDLTMYGISHVEHGRRALSDRRMDLLLAVLGTDLSGLMSDDTLRLPPPSGIHEIRLAAKTVCRPVSARVKALREEVRARLLAVAADPKKMAALSHPGFRPAVVFRILAGTVVSHEALQSMKERLEALFPRQ